MGVTTAVGTRRRLVTRLGALSAVLLVAGVLPWATWGDLSIRLLALPMLLAGLLVAGLALRVHAAGRPAPAEQLGCGGCQCGGGGCGTEPADADATPAGADRSAAG